MNGFLHANDSIQEMRNIQFKSQKGFYEVIIILRKTKNEHYILKI